eukprot:6602522-Karenia_brevis.AAC.1
MQCVIYVSGAQAHRSLQCAIYINLIQLRAPHTNDALMITYICLCEHECTKHFHNVTRKRTVLQCAISITDAGCFVHKSRGDHVYMHAQGAGISCHADPVMHACMGFFCAPKFGVRMRAEHVFIFDITAESQRRRSLWYKNASSDATGFGTRIHSFCRTENKF